MMQLSPLGSRTASELLPGTPVHARTMQKGAGDQGDLSTSFSTTASGLEGHLGGSSPHASASHRASFRQSSLPGADGVVAGGRQPGPKRRDDARTRSRKKFVYVKLNRAHLRITYQGYPLGIRDRILVVNSYTCENLDGRWRDLLANVKQKAILSAVWSTLGLQGRKIKELMEGAAPAVHMPPPRAEDDGRGAKGLLAKMGLAPKAKKDAAPAEEMSEEDVIALQKKRALFGDQMMRSMAKIKGSVAHGAALASAAVTGVAGAIATTRDAPLDGSVPASPAGSAGPSAHSTPAVSPTKTGAAARRTLVPPLDLQRPLPPEEPAMALSGGSRGRPSGEYESGAASPVKSTRGLSSRSGSARLGEDVVAALLGPGFQHGQPVQGQSSQEKAEDAAQQLLGYPSPRKGASGWMQQLSSKALGNRRRGDGKDH